MRHVGDSTSVGVEHHTTVGEAPPLPQIRNHLVDFLVNRSRLIASAPYEALLVPDTALALPLLETTDAISAFDW